MARKGAAAPSEVAAFVPLAATPINGLGWGLKLHRHTEPKDWPAALANVPEEHRADAEEYLRGIAARMRALRQLQRNRGEF